MKERPILFSGPMVRAILEGRKTQTRRVVRDQDRVEACEGEVIHLHGSKCGGFCDYACEPMVCPYGKPGDRLWVRETFARLPLKSRLTELVTVYRATDWNEEDIRLFNWLPSIFMRREYSRIALEIVDVRVERLCSIQRSDAFAEGIEPKPDPMSGQDWTVGDRFRDLWDSINASRGFGWATNPWVWVVEFKVLQPVNSQHGDPDCESGART